MSYELTGKIIEIFDTIQRTEKFAVREFIVEVSETAKDKTYSQPIKLQATNERTIVLDNMSIGDEVKVHFNIRGAKWEKDGKTSYFNNLDAWKIESLKKAMPEIKGMKYTSQEVVEAEVVSDDLPF